MIKRILVGLGGTNYTPVAIERAVTLAQAHAAEVTGVTVVDKRQLRGRAPPAPGNAGAVITEDRIAQSIREFEETCAKAQVPHALVEETGDPFSRLVDLSRYHDLMVFGLRSIFESDYLGAAPQELLVQLVAAGVRPIIAVSDKFRPIYRVLIAYSGSMESAAAMKRFVQMRLWPQAHLRVMTFHPSEDEANKLLFAADAYCRSHGCHVEHQSNPGQAQDLLLAAAALWKADMIVMGNSARSVWGRRLLGDTLLQVLTQTKLPLFLAQ